MLLTEGFLSYAVIVKQFFYKRPTIHYSGHGAPLQAAPDHSALWSRQRPRRTIEHARVKRRELGQAVRGDGPGMQLQMREGPRRGRARARHSRLVMYRQQWSLLNECAVRIKQHAPRCCVFT
jgi:hypothetical protein